MTDDSARDYSAALGGAALGARLRRLSDRIDREIVQIYADRGIAFEQRWFGVLNQIVLNEGTTVVEIAAALRISHVSVSQAVGSLLRAGYLDTEDDPRDGRRRLLKLSAAGKQLVEQLTPLWRSLEQIAEALNEEAGNLVAGLDRLEQALDARPFAARLAR